MTNYIVCLIIQRFILPVLLTTCFILRPTALSLPYLLFLFYLPFVAVANAKSFKGHTGYYIKFLIFITVILSLIQLSFHIIFQFVFDNPEVLENCGLLQLIFRHIGLVKLNNLDALTITQFLAPEVLCLVGSVFIFLALRPRKRQDEVLPDDSGEAQVVTPDDDNYFLGPDKWRLLLGAGKVLSLIALCLAGAIQPSVPSAIYFIVFLGAATWWGCNKELERTFAIFLRITLFFLIVHITSYLIYQNPWPQEFLTPNSTIPRIMGLTAIYSSSCIANESDVRVIDFDDNLDMDKYFNILVLIVCYLTISITSCLLLGPQPEVEEKKIEGPFVRLDSVPKTQRQVSFRMQRKNMLRKTLNSDKWRGAARKVKGHVRNSHRQSTPYELPNERTPLMRSGTRKVSDSKPDPQATNAQGDSIALELIGSEIITEEDEDSEPSQSLFEQIALAAGAVAIFIYKNSYIFTNVVMMAWSIIYHSWLGFVLLIWANIIWVIPNQRKNMLGSSPFLVIYAIFLLLATYLYGMDLTEDELPSNLKYISLTQIGFIKYEHYSFAPILLKSVFTIMFWASLRQMMQERKEVKKSSCLADMVAPLQITVGAATASMPKKLEIKESAFVIKAGQLINAFLIKFWIWIVAVTLFVCGIAGTQMTGFRIIYMALFLIFVLTFQFSFSSWRNFMYGFWLLVIIYSMLILVLVYTYQFDKFSDYWNDYLYISETLQRDIGMEKYDAKQLFLHLVTPTAIVIITVIQLHYCHLKFLELSEIPQNQTEDGVSKTSSAAYGTFIPSRQDDTDNDETEDNTDFLEDINIRKLSKHEIKNVANKLITKIVEIAEIVLLFFEIHFIKMLLLAAFVLGVDEVKFIHLGYVFLAVLALRAKTEVQVLITRIASMISAILLISTMIYQVDYIDHANYEANCTNVTNVKEVTNNAIWVGFSKASKEQKLYFLIRPYLMYIVIVSIHAVIILRQTIKRIKMGKSPRTPSVVFPKIKRADADKDIAHLLKYLINYGFYRFGTEICLVFYIVVIGSRMDLVACFYSVWLCTLFYQPRETLAKYWQNSTVFMLVIIPVQYILLIGLPPGLCVVYPWLNVKILEDFNIWAMLPQNTLDFKAKSKNLILDYVLLVLLCRQLIVFRIEARYDSTIYAGGSNKSVLDDIDQLGTKPFVNPTKYDFIDKIRNYLDILKRFVFIMFFWCTLAIVFLTGTNRVNLFSIGYIIGSFTFLWQGTDFYLRPIHTILKWWNYLIGYNVAIVTTKTMIQMLGCLFLDYLKNSNCWFVQMFGITCLCSLNNPPPEADTSDDTCMVPLEDAGLLWDGVCFAFLMLQRRMFASHYFCYVINEAKASLILASRGNELIEDLRSKDMKLEIERESQILQKIKTKMDRIKATQQRILEEHDTKTHAADDLTAPMVRSHSLSSCGYHTPIEDDDDEDDSDLNGAEESMLIEGEGLSEMPSDLPGVSTSRGGSFLTTQAQSPSSALMTVSLEGYLDPLRISYDSPGDLDLIPRIASPDDTFPVFSPPPYEMSDQTVNQNMLAIPHGKNGSNDRTSTTNPGRRHRRQSSLNTVSWPNQTELTVSPRVKRRMSNFTINIAPVAIPDESEEKSLASPKFKSPRRRKSSVGTSVAQDEITLDPSRRRSSFAPSWAIDDDECGTTTRGGDRRRKYSWGQVGEQGFMESCRSAASRSPVSHHEYSAGSTRSKKRAIRSGDYYMFEDVEDEFELDLFNQKELEDEEDKKSATRRRLSKKMTFGQLMTKMKEDAEKERIEQEEQELLEKQKKLALAARRSSSPALQRQQTTSEVLPGRAVNSEPIARHSQFDPASSSIGIETGFDDEETEGLIQADGQKPSTSRGIPDDEDSSGSEQKLIKNESIQDEDEKKESELAKKKKFLIDKLMLIPTFLSSILCSITIRLHSVSRSYRYVMRVLAREKRMLKHTPGFGAGFRTGASMIWTPIQNAKSSRDSPPRSYQNVDDQAVVSRRSSKSSVISVSSNCLAQAESYSRVEDRTDRDSIISSPARLDTEIGSPSKLIKNDRPKEEVEDLRRCSLLPEIRLIAPSLERGLEDYDDEPFDPPFRFDSEVSLERTKEVVIKVEENYEIDEDDFASKEHSIIVELFQALWYVILSHTDFICYTAVFVNQINSASILSIPLPLMVLLWGTLTFPRPSKTFWVTLIAYTQTVVLLKCLSQFEVLPWNQNNLPNQPFAPAKILGIERKKGYATYDLILLLMIFVHRIILKSLGLWKSDVIASTEDVAIEDKYKVPDVDEQIQKDTLQIENEKQTISIERNTDKSVDISEDLVVEQIEEVDSTDYVKLAKISFEKYLSSVKGFLAQLFDRQSRKTADVYGLLFLCDFVNFFVILFGFSAFGTQEGDGGVMSYFEENKVPITFLLMLIIQFFLIVIDRALYLRKYMMGKIIFQLFLVIGLHIWMFFILPATTERIFNSTNPPVTYYLIKCLYLLFSAYQIRCGYPARILGNFLTKGFNIMNNVGFKVFMIIPFLFELRTLMDWVWTDTSMTLFDWLKMEDIFVNVYQLKCSRQLEGDLPAPRGQKKGPMVKYLMGGGMILGVIAVIWFPMALFAFSNTVGEPNIPYDVSVSLRIGPYEPVYVMSAQDSDIFQLTEKNWGNFLQPYSKDKSALTFLSNYEHVDVAAVKLGSNSSTIWNISPPDKDRLLDDLKSNGTLTCRFRYTITRVSNSKENPPIISEEKSYELLSNNVARLQLTEMLEGNKSMVTVALPTLFPKFLKVKNSGSLKPAHQLLKAAKTDDDDGNYRNLSMRLLQTGSNASLPQYWWEARELCGDVDPDYKNIFSMMPYSDCLTHITIYLFNDKIFPSTLGAIAGGGIIGLYTTLIFFFSRFLRGSIFSGSSSKIMFEDLPYVDRILQLCLDIYLVRESLEFCLEEDLFAKLIFLYRSPETMIKWTRPKNEKGEDESSNDGDSSKTSLRKKNE